MTYSHTVQAAIPLESWDEAYFSMLSLKAHLQSLPGWLGMSFVAREQKDDRVEATIVTEWDTLGAVTVWAASHSTPDAVLRALEAPPDRMTVRLNEVMA
jgi:heme-degrading monooxygenase HmoA